MQYRENFCNTSPFKDHAFNVNKISLLACMIPKYSKYTTFYISEHLLQILAPVTN